MANGIRGKKVFSRKQSLAGKGFWTFPLSRSGDSMEQEWGTQAGGGGDEEGYPRVWHRQGRQMLALLPLLWEAVHRASQDIHLGEKGTKMCPAALISGCRSTPVGSIICPALLAVYVWGCITSQASWSAGRQKVWGASMQPWAEGKGGTAGHCGSCRTCRPGWLVTWLTPTSVSGIRPDAPPPGNLPQQATHPWFHWIDSLNNTCCYCC